MSNPADWALAYARQAGADFHAWELYEQHPKALAAECHKLLFLQMACEKLCKAYLIQISDQPMDLQASHGYTAKHLPTIVRRQILALGEDPARRRGVLTLARHISGEVELLNPAVRRGGARQDNCEYPWSAGDRVVSPLDWTFQPLRLMTVRGGYTFLRLLKGAITRTITELER